MREDSFRRERENPPQRFTPKKRPNAFEKCGCGCDKMRSRVVCNRRHNGDNALPPIPAPMRFI